MTYSESQSQQEVNDILSSIRQMISEEDSDKPKSLSNSSFSSLTATSEKADNQILDLTRLVQEDGSVIELASTSDKPSLVPQKSDVNLEITELPFAPSSFTATSLNSSKQENNAMRQNEEFDVNTFETQIDKADEGAFINQKQAPDSQLKSSSTAAFSDSAQNYSHSSPTDDNFLSARTVQESAAAFAALSRATENRSSQENNAPPTAATVSDYTVDTLMRELLKPLLKEWLDAHLPSLVKSLVLEQIEKVLQQPKTVVAA